MAEKKKKVLDVADSPLVSVVTAAHNAEIFFTETIKTVREQGYRNWEWIIVDDKSDDGTVAIINETLKQTGDKRIRLIKLDRNSGAARARNAGIRAAQGRFLAFLDADDLWAHDKLAWQVDFMRKNDCAFSFTGYEFADAFGKPNGKVVRVPSEISYRQALRNTTVWTSTVISRFLDLYWKEKHLVFHEKSIYFTYRYFDVMKGAM